MQQRLVKPFLLARCILFGMAAYLAVRCAAYRKRMETSDVGYQGHAIQLLTALQYRKLMSCL